MGCVTRPLVPLIKSAKPGEKIYMFEPKGEFINFPGLAAFYGTLGRGIFLFLFLFAEKESIKGLYLFFFLIHWIYLLSLYRSTYEKQKQQ